jgi:hypothetical protein
MNGTETRSKLRRRIARLRSALQPLADVPLERDSDPTCPDDRISGPDFAITPAHVRAARSALDRL